MTKTQKSILETVSGEGVHLTAEEIRVKLRDTCPNASLGTVYRNLTHFAETGVLRRIRRADLPDVFDCNIKPHDHAICVKCGKICDLLIPELLEYIKSHTELRLINAELMAKCVCDDCLKTT